MDNGDFLNNQQRGFGQAPEWAAAERGVFQHCSWVVHMTVAIELTQASVRSGRSTQDPGEMVDKDGKKQKQVFGQ